MKLFAPAKKDFQRFTAFTRTAVLFALGAVLYGFVALLFTAGDRDLILVFGLFFAGVAVYLMLSGINVLLRSILNGAKGG